MKGAKSVVPSCAGQRSSRFEPRTVDAQRRVFEVLVNPDNDRKPEAEKAALAGMAPRTWRKHRSRELTQEALAARRAAYARYLPAIDEALLRKAREGSLSHILLAYERIEGWRPGSAGRVRDRTTTSNDNLWNCLSESDRQRFATILAGQLRRADPDVQGGCDV
jgi:hypothetical protein